VANFPARGTRLARRVAAVPSFRAESRANASA
jgi:hypothetical protein